MQANSIATVLVNNQRVPSVAVVGFLASHWGVPGTKAIFCEAYRFYHNQCALDLALDKGHIDCDVRIYGESGDLPEYVIGSYYHLKFVQ